MKKRKLTAPDVLKRFQAERDKYQSLSATARALKISRSFLDDILRGTRNPGEDALQAVGLRKVVTVHYEDISEAER